MSKTTKNDEEIFFPDRKKVTLRGEEVVIKPFVLKTRVIVLKFISEIMSELVDENPNLKEADTMQVGMALIKTAGERMIEIYRVVIEGKKDEWFQLLTLKDEVTILKVISEVNDFPFLLREIQSLYANSATKE